jgi:hypothetical protein
MFGFYSVEDLASRLGHIRRNGNRYAFCVGAGLTAPLIPGTKESLLWMAAELDSKEDKEAFSAATAGKTGGEAYQAGADVLIGRRGQSALNAAVRSMILMNAYRPAIERAEESGEAEEFDEGYCARAEADIAGWKLPDAVRRLADLLLDGDRGTGGLVVTTNFDPLIQIAVRAAGGAAVTEIFDADGGLGNVDPGDAVIVAHLHGFWQRNDTLHTPVQLTSTRDALQGSLEDLLRERTMLVTGYGGWDDVFTGALVEAVRRHRAGDLDVLWTFLGDNQDHLQVRHRGLFEAVGSVPGRITFFGGIDCEGLFELMGSPAPDHPAEKEEEFRSPLEGFTAVTGDFLSRQAELSTLGKIRFFDGQLPNWPIALSGEIPMLEAASGARSAVEGGVERDELSIVLLEGPAGEGKSTALRQVAADFAGKEGWRVLWREPGIDPRLDLANLECGNWQWLLAIDDAEIAARACLDLLAAAREKGRSDIHVALAARTADWRAAGNTGLPWATQAAFTTVPVRGVSQSDAAALVECWAGAGPKGMGELGREKEPERRAEIVWRAAQEEALQDEGSLLGAMLRVRIGDGLQDHVRTLGAKFDRVRLSSGASLLQAFLYVACLHANGVTSLRPEALAAALGVPRARVHREVIWPLGEEAAVATSGSSLMVRHRSIADVAVKLAPEWGEDLADCYYEIIKGTIHAFREDVFIPDLADIVYLPKKLVGEPRLALRAARAPVEEEPERLSYWVSLVTVMRKVGRAEEGMEIARRSYANLEGMVDRHGSRALLHEWAVCAGVTGHPALDAYLAIWSLADEPTPSARRLEPTHSMMATRGLSEALGALTQWVKQPWLADAEEAVSLIQGHIEANREVDDPGGLVATLEVAAGHLALLAESEWPGEAIAPPSHLSFTQMERLLQKPKAPSSSPGSLS